MESITNTHSWPSLKYLLSGTKILWNHVPFKFFWGWKAQSAHLRWNLQRSYWLCEEDVSNQWCTRSLQRHGTYDSTRNSRLRVILWRLWVHEAKIDTGRQIGQGLASLFANVCRKLWRYVNVPCKYVYPFKQTSGYRPGSCFVDLVNLSL